MPQGGDRVGRSAVGSGWEAALRRGDWGRAAVSCDSHWRRLDASATRLTLRAFFVVVVVGVLVVFAVEVGELRLLFAPEVFFRLVGPVVFDFVG